MQLEGVSRAWSVAALIALIGIVACAREGEEEAEPAVQEPAAEPTGVSADLSTPESVLHDAAADVYLVSNINGSPLEKDDNGYISRVSPDGEMVAARWIDGAKPEVTLHAPKGLAIKGDTLFVSDLDSVRAFDRNSGAALGGRGVANATFLNDLAVGPDGLVYVTDSGLKGGAQGFEPSGSDAIYYFGPRGAVAIAKGSDLNRPNGIATAPNEVIVVPSGGKEIYRIDKAGKRTTFATLPAGQLDGVVRLEDGALLVS
ncbi:MAG: hypothetical protein HY561_04890, partial [Gemmatimonadetes bacterium]|nr:hypothetical protein [Gemmatimonadota bacterium]